MHRQNQDNLPWPKPRKPGLPLPSPKESPEPPPTVRHPPAIGGQNPAGSGLRMPYRQTKRHPSSAHRLHPCGPSATRPCLYRLSPCSCLSGTDERLRYARPSVFRACHLSKVWFYIPSPPCRTDRMNSLSPPPVPSISPVTKRRRK